MSIGATPATTTGTDSGAPPVIDVRGLTKRYGGRAVVDHFDMRVPKGRIYGFLGPNGSGKTTTIRMLCGLLTPDEGEGTCLGYDIRRESRLIKRQVGYMTQKFGLYEDLSIAENLDFIARIYQVPQRPAKVEATLQQLGLASRRNQLAGALSGGWKQRLALAACLLHEPQLLLLDEPTAGVDPKARREFWDHLHELAAAGLTVLVSTHYMDEAERCHELAYISYGRLLAQGTAAQLIAAAGLVTYAIQGPDLIALAHQLREQPAIRSVASFGNALHVSASSQQELDAALAALRVLDVQRSEQLQITAIEPNLEDVFIALMQGVKDNYD
ncbi:ATP-binding cassette domain-containing protein [Undibacterium arcticum]|uniref:ATP-binding cassette domain-containing protein n=1 Tax=Undibacterium arcticum TaxID=1762892 RepID=A0ABV7F4B4_9BURK